MTTAGSSSLTARARHQADRLWRAVVSPLRVRVYSLVVVSTVMILFAIRVLDGGADSAGRDLASLRFQEGAAAAAASVSARTAAIETSLASADALVAHGHDLSHLCGIMRQDPRPPYQRLAVFTPSGETRCTTVVSGGDDQPDAIRARAYFQAALATGDNQVGGPLVGALSGRPSLLFAHPIRGAAATVGVVTGAVDVTEILQSAGSPNRSMRIIVVGRDGGQFELGASEASVLPDKVAAEVSRALAAEVPCHVLAVDGIAWACSPAARTGLMIVTGHPERVVYAVALDGVTRQSYRAIGVVLIAIMATGASDFLFLRRIRRAYGNVDLAVRGMADTTNRDEIDVLVEWTQSAGDTLRRLQGELDSQERRRLESDRDLLTSIAEAVEARYPFLRDHGDRVGQYARQIGSRLGIRGDDLDQLEFAARIHDLGKIAIADAVYLKRGPLDPIEITQMQLHATRGAELVSHMRAIPTAVEDAVRHHHERWDGKGYPEALARTAIPLWSRVIAVADGYDAMTEQRPYRDHPLTHEQAVQTLRDGAGSQWDSTVVVAFIEVVESGEFPRKASGPPG